MYFNIGMKTVYLEVFQQAFGFPPISTRKGRIAWYCLGPCYWILAFVIAAAVPNLGGIVSLVGALFMINFTYSFPGMLYLAWIVQKAAALPGEGFNPYTRVTTRMDNGTKRWIRGFKKSWAQSVPCLIYVIAGLACCGMGIWAAIEGLISVFGPGGTVATCEFCVPSDASGSFADLFSKLSVALRLCKLLFRMQRSHSSWDLWARHVRIACVLSFMDTLRNGFHDIPRKDFTSYTKSYEFNIILLPSPELAAVM